MPLLFGFLVRAVAQPGSALAWGARGREFESHRPDHFTDLRVKLGRLCDVESGSVITRPALSHDMPPIFTEIQGSPARRRDSLKTFAWSLGYRAGALRPRHSTVAAGPLPNASFSSCAGESRRSWLRPIGQATHGRSTFPWEPENRVLHLDREALLGAPHRACAHSPSA